ncbi:MAG: TlpA disulfide reductase family protein [Bacteroidales bacterium]|nr:TlpA disulfide reductase family protein [Bacteroidales bacterium]
MKNLILFALVIVVLYSCGSKNSGNTQVVIDGKITNHTDDKVIVSYNLDSDTLKLNDDGSFEAEILIYKPSYVNLTYGDNKFAMFLAPGNKISLELNSKDFIETLIFKDDNAEINNYLAEQMRVYNSKANGENSFVYSNSYDDFIKSFNAYVAEFEKQIQKMDEKYGSEYESFITTETQKLKLIKHSILTDFLFYTWDVEIEIPDNAFDDLSTLESEIIIDNPDLIYFEQYWPFLSDLLTNKTSAAIKDAGISDCSMEQWCEYYFAEIDKCFKNEQALDAAYFYFIRQFVEYYGPLSVSDVFDKYKETSKSKGRIANITALLAEYETIAPGKPSVDWTFEDINGKTVSQSDFKGKYIYIDVWASWCGPCRAEIPYLEKLKTKFIGKNIVFVSISVDDDKESWEKALTDEKVEGIQLYAGGWSNELCRYYKINSIPRFILIGKDLNIINSDADRPSGEIEKVLSNLDGI